MIFSFGTFEPKFAQRCWESQRLYAERIGQPYQRILIGHDKFATRLKLRLMNEYGPDKGRILYLDWDMEISKDAEDIFKIEDRMCMYRDIGNYGWPCASLLLGNIEDFRKMIPFFNMEYMKQSVSPFREEIATSLAAKMIGIKPIEIYPKGFKHWGGPLKWSENE